MLGQYFRGRYFVILILSALGLGLGLTGCAITNISKEALHTQTARQFSDVGMRIEVPMPSITLLDRTSVGSGLLLSTDTGVTCAHVLQGRLKDKPIKAYISGNEHIIHVIGTDEKKDIAVFSIAPPASSGAVFRSFAQIPVVGQPIRVTGFPLSSVIADKLPTVTGGIVSGVNRAIVCDGEHINGLIQVDAVTSDGNSGGPVTTIDGRIIGMVVFSASGSKAEWRGATFAIPIETVESVARNIMSSASVKKRRISKEMAGISSVKKLITK